MTADFWINRPRNRRARRTFGRRCAAYYAANYSLPADFPRVPARYGLSERIDDECDSYRVGYTQALADIAVACDELAAGWPEMITKAVSDSLDPEGA